ncbi:MAG TPA: hypothetical protein VJ385_17105 [Fibrobacteria bacterium]|nr:hypothetical protein [Fibrobacteria bacterium]
MYSLHLTGNPWFLLLIPPGLWILWRQYRGLGEAGGFRRAGGLLFALQALALVLLAASLTAPELRRHRVEFHNPAVLILRDQSASFRDGAYLGLGARYRDFETSLAQAYGGRKFDVKVIDFAEAAWPVSGFPEPGRPEAGEPDGDGAALTSLAALADFVDSAAVPNLQAAFLFSDGRSNLDSGRAPPNWRIPLYPVVFPPDSIGEVQPERVQASPGGAPGGAMDVEAAWRWVGRPGQDPTLKILQGNRVLLARKLSAGSGVNRFSWSRDKASADNRLPLRAVLEPASPAADFDPYNDTLGVALLQGRAERNIHVFRPVRSLDEKGMLGILQGWEGTRVAFFGAEDIGKMALAPGDQVWVEAGSLGPQSRLQDWLQATPAQVVIYARPEPGRNPRLPGLSGAPWRSFTPAAEIRAGKAAAEAFPDEVVRLGNLTAEPLDAPEAPGLAWVEALEGGKRGMLMGRIPLGPGKRAFFFALPATWGALFDPQGDFATRENVAAYVRAAQISAGREDGAVRISRPARAYHLVPFDVEVRAPEKTGTGKEPAGPLAFSVSGDAGFSRQWPVDGPVKGVALPRGKYLLELKAGPQRLWSDSLEVAPKAALELARIGFDRGALEDAASRSGGAVLVPPERGGGASDSAWVTFVLPDLPAAQIRVEKTASIRLYNTLAQCLLVLLLLSLSWFLRKKWDMD